MITIIDFWAEWCGPCKQLSPVLSALEKEHSNLKLIKINVDESPEIATKYQVTSIPTMHILVDDEHVETVVGAKPKPFFDKFFG